MRRLDNFDRNHLLASLLEAGCEDLRSRLELVSMTFGDVLYEAGSKFAHVYFPTTSVVSLLSVMEDGASDEIAFVGCEGIVGAPLFLGADGSLHRVVVRSAGYALRLKGQLLLEEFNRSGWPTATIQLGQPVSQLPVQLCFGQELVVRTAQQSALLISSPASPL